MSYDNLELEIACTAMRVAGRYTVAIVLKNWTLWDSFWVFRAISTKTISSCWIWEMHKERGRNFSTKDSQVPRHLPSTITDSHLSSFSTHIEYGQTILKSKYRRNAGHSLPTLFLKRPWLRWPPSRPCSLTINLPGSAIMIRGVHNVLAISFMKSTCYMSI